MNDKKNKTIVNQSDIKQAVEALGIVSGDTVIVHSSFKSMGYVEGGAEAVVKGYLDVLGKEGTLVFPTLIQKDFEKAYETWHLDKDSDVGYLTNYFRKREGSYRSDQATHSVAACGKYARYLTETHGHTHKRFGNMGDTPFSADSPWEKMYLMDAKIVLLGVPYTKITFRHYAEYIFIEKCLKSIEEHPDYERMKEKLWKFGKPGVWPHVYNIWVAEQLDKQGVITVSKCGNAEFKCIPVKLFVDFVLKKLEEGCPDVLWKNDRFWDTDAYIAWYQRLLEMQKECK